MLGQLIEEFLQSIQELVIQITGLATNSGVARGEAGSGEVLGEIIDFFPLRESIEKYRHRPAIHGKHAHAKQVTGNAGHLTANQADHLPTRRQGPIQQLFHRHHVGDIVCQRGKVIQPVRVGNELVIMHVFRNFFVSPMEEAHIRNRLGDDLSFQFQYQAQHAMRRGMARTHVQDQLLPDNIGGRFLVSFDLLRSAGSVIRGFYFTDHGAHERQSE